jgi:hypothetical protein
MHQIEVLHWQGRRVQEKSAATAVLLALELEWSWAGQIFVLEF